MLRIDLALMVFPGRPVDYNIGQDCSPGRRFVTGFVSFPQALPMTNLLNLNHARAASRDLHLSMRCSSVTSLLAAKLVQSGQMLLGWQLVVVVVEGKDCPETTLRKVQPGSFLWNFLQICVNLQPTRSSFNPGDVQSFSTMLFPLSVALSPGSFTATARQTDEMSMKP